MFAKAVKSQAKGRVAVTGPSGAGKTMTSLIFAKVLAGGKPVAAIDSEYKSMSKYADEFDFDVVELNGNYHPSKYIEAIKAAESAGYGAVVIDSITHAWNGTKDVVDKKKLASNSQNGYTAWAEGTKLWDSLTEAIMSSTIHVIVTMRSKTDYVQEKDEKGKTQIRKVGMAPEVRDGTEFAFDLVVDMDHEHVGRVSKTRCRMLDGHAELKPGEAFAKTFRDWLENGIKAPQLAADADRDALLADLKAAGFAREDLARVMGATKLKDMTVEQYDALGVMLAQHLDPRREESTTIEEGNAQ